MEQVGKNVEKDKALPEELKNSVRGSGTSSAGGSIILGKMKHQSSPGFPKLQPDKNDGLSFITPFTEMILFRGVT